MPDDSLNLLTDLIKKARAAGADAADCVFIRGTSLSLARRLGKPEQLDRSESTDLGLRVFVGDRQAVASTSDMAADALDELVERALAMARSVPEDPYCGMARPEELAREVAELDMCEAAEPSIDDLTERAAGAEDAALAVSGVTNSEGAQATWSRSSIALAGSNGFAETYAGSRSALFVSVLAGEGTAMERDYDSTSAVHSGDLRPPAEVGRQAGEKAVRRLNPRKAETAQVPVIFDPRVGRSLLNHLASAINGSAVARGTTFLKDKLESRIFAEGVTIVDDPVRRRGHRSKPFDAEGVAPRRRNVVVDGVLTTWILDLRSARQLGLATTGHASRGPSSPPAPSATNLYLEAGTATPEGLMADVESGFYVTELIGFGVNGLTGDYSRGATGFWIENGGLAYPVSEVTIAGNLNQMFANLSAADDLKFDYGIDAPSVRVDGMTVSGK